ncbi:MAG: hypothetical protein GY841_13295 [FCB group bacterium]|nr:hypothetical protein [FCB group bacterium]
MIDRTNIDDRIVKCNKILDENPGSQIFAALADAHRKKGELDKAFRICQNGLKVHPDYGSAHMVMAKVNMDKGLYDWAETEIEKAIELDGATRAAELLLSEIYIYKGEFNGACRLLEKLIDADPGNEQIQKLLDIARKIPLDTSFDPAKSKTGPQLIVAKEKQVQAIESPIERNKDEAPEQPASIPDLNDKQFLRAMIGTPGVDGALMVNVDGLVAEVEWNVPGKTDLVAALTAETARLCTIQMRECGLGDLKSMLIESENSLTYLSGVRGKILAVVCSDSVNLGSLRLKLGGLLPRLSA